MPRLPPTQKQQPNPPPPPPSYPPPQPPNPETTDTIPSASTPTQDQHNDQLPYPSPHHRPRSSWYSQPSATYYSSGIGNPWHGGDVPPVPEIGQEYYGDGKRDGDGASEYDGKRNDGYERTAVSECIIHRGGSWIDQSVKERGVLRRVSSERSNSMSEEQVDFTRDADADQDVDLETGANGSSGGGVTGKVRGWFGKTKDTKDGAVVSTQKPMRARSVASAHTNHSISPATNTTATLVHSPDSSDTRNALLRGLSQRYTPKTTSTFPSPLTKPHPHPQTHRSPLRPSLWYPSPPRLHTHTYNPPPLRPGSKPMPNPTRDATSHCDQGKFLGIGTMRAVTPAGVDLLEGWMVNAVEKGDVEKGVGRVRRWLRGEGRGTVEWVGGWLRGRWGVEL